MPPRLAHANYIRNFIFGVEDSLVSTVGLLSGVAVAGMSPQHIFLTGLILIFVEACSMSAGSFLSEASAEEYLHQKETSSSHSYSAALIMFFSYVLSGFIPLLPYVLFPLHIALPVSIGASVITLGVLGCISARLSSTNYLKSVVRMMGIGGIAILIGVVIGGAIG